MPEPLWINYDPVSGTPQYDANELRQAMALALMYDGRAVGARQGVRPGGTQLQVSLAGSTITVQPGLCVVDPGVTSTQGPYWVSIPVAENPVGGPLAAADATNPRKDIVVARVYDHDQDASGLRLARSEYRAGAAGPTPSLPAVLAGEILLATIDVPRSGNGAAVVTNVYPYTVASGGILPVRAAGDIAAGVPGRYRDRLDTGTLERDKGPLWETVADPTVFTPWTAWAPSTPGAALVVGNGTFTGRYKQVGKIVQFYFQLTWGSTTSWPGTGWLVNLPAVAFAVSPSPSFVVSMWDSSAGINAGRYLGEAHLDNTSRILLSAAANGGGNVTPTAPFTWAAGDVLKISGTYETA